MPRPYPRCRRPWVAASATVAASGRRASPHRGRSPPTTKREDARRLGERLGQLELAMETQSYEQAIVGAERGEESARLISCFGLTEGEADLVMLLHGEASRRAAVEQFARRLIDTAHP